MRGSHISDDGRFKLLGIFVPSGSCMVATCQDDAFCEYRDNETGKNVYTCMECVPTATLQLPLTEAVGYQRNDQGDLIDMDSFGDKVR